MRFVPLILVLLLPLQTRAAEAPSKPPELKVLDKLVGEWTTEGHVTVLDGQPQNLKSTGAATRKWSLDGRIVEEDGKGDDGNSVKVIFTYDAMRKAYRWWYFSNSGICLEFTGQWNDALQTFSFQSDLGNGMIQTASVRFTDQDHQEWASKVIDNTGKVLFDGRGKLTRKK